MRIRLLLGCLGSLIAIIIANFAIAQVQAPSLLKDQKCQSATAGLTINEIFGDRGDAATIGREVLPYVTTLRHLESIIYGNKPLEVVCTFNPRAGFQQLNLVFGIDRSNYYATPANVIAFAVYADSKLTATTKVIAGDSSQSISLPVSGVRNIALRAECQTSRCPALVFVDMSLR